MTVLVQSDDVELETALRQVVSDAVTSAGVIDIYEAAGIARPDISMIDEAFGERLSTEPHPNLQIELLRRLLATEVSVPTRNVVAERRFSELLERAMKAYNNRSLTAAEVIAELVELAKEMKIEHERVLIHPGFRDDELAFYDAVCQNDSAVMELGDEVLNLEVYRPRLGRGGA